MKVSIIIPVYNVEAYLDECLESVARLGVDFEAILVNDGSTDSSGQICDRWCAGDSRFRTVHQANGGLSAARNTGIRHADGDYLLFLDSDDFLDPQQTEMLLGQMDTGADFLMGLYRNYYGPDEKSEPEPASAFGQETELLDSGEFARRVPCTGKDFYMIACRFLPRRRFLLEHGLFFTEKIYHEDEEWTARLVCCAGNAVVTRCCFYIYRQNREGSITSGVKPKSVIDKLYILESFGRYIQNMPDTPNRHYVERRMAMLYMGIQIDMPVLHGEEKRQALKTLRAYRSRCIPLLEGKIGKSVGFMNRLTGLRATQYFLTAAKKLIRGDKNE